MSIKTVDLFNGGDYTGKTPVSLSFYGTEFAFEKWADLCAKFFEKTQEIRSEKLEDLARGGSRYLRVKNERKEKRPYRRLNRSNLFLDVGFCTNDHIKHIRDLIKYCDLDVSNISIRYMSTGDGNESERMPRFRYSNNATLFNSKIDDTFTLILIELPGVVPQKIKDVLIVDYPNGFDFNGTTVRLLQTKTDCSFTEEELRRLKAKMYKRGDGLYFLHDSIVDREVCLQICEYANVVLDKFHCFELDALYGRFGRNFNSVCIRDLKDFEEWFFTRFSGNVKATNYGDGRFIRLKSIRQEVVIEELAQKISYELKKNGGTLEEEKALTIFDAFSSKFLHELIRQETDDVIVCQINGRTCFQTFDAMGIPEDFTTELSKTLSKIDEFELEPTLEIINALLSLVFGYNFRKNFNIPNDKTYRRLIETYYQCVARSWKSGFFRESDE